MVVKFVDLSPAWDEVRSEIETRWQSVHKVSSYIGGPEVEAFEREFAHYCGAKTAVGVASGTDAIRLVLQALGVGNGDTVITVPNSFVASISPAVSLGALPAFVDIDLSTFNMDPESLSKFLELECEFDRSGILRSIKNNSRIAAIIAVHLYGRSAPVQDLVAIADKFGIPVVEDACQAHGALLRTDRPSSRTGSVGIAGCFSFYPAKNLGALGDGGAIVTDDLELSATIRRQRDHSQTKKYHHVAPDGTTSRLDAIQAVVLRTKLSRLDDWNSRRVAIADNYRSVLGEIPQMLPSSAPLGTHVYHLFVIRAQKRDLVVAELDRLGIETGLHYPIPIHLQSGFQRFGFRRGDFPRAELACEEVISLPMYPHMPDRDIERVTVSVLDSLAQITDSAPGSTVD